MSGTPSIPPESPSPDELRIMLESIRGRVRTLTVAVLIMAMATLLSAAAVFGYLTNYFAGDPLIFGGVSMGAAILGFAFGWIARRRA